MKAAARAGPDFRITPCSCYIARVAPDQFLGTRCPRSARSPMILRHGRSSLLCVPALAALAFPAALAAQPCGTPGRDGSPTLTGIVNTYYPGTATAAAGATSISVGTPSGSTARIAAGDLLLVIQMQDAAINTSNTTAYGGNNGSGAG